MFTRRSIAGGILASAAGAASAQLSGYRSPGGLRVRRNISTMAANDPDLQALRYAIGQMRATTGSLSWLTQRQVHAAPWGHHNSWRFLPWHRFQLYYLERIIAKVSGKADFAYPYWNWDDDRAPAVFFQRRSPLYDATRTINWTSKISDYIGFEWSSGVAGRDFWARTDNEFGDFFGSPNPSGEPGMGYAGSGEQYGHNLVHLFCGGRMRNLVDSPLDPIFWSHHANLDRQWAIWTEVHGARNFPGEWGAEPCTGYVDDDGYLASARTASESIDTRPLGYTYDDVKLAYAGLAREAWPGAPDPAPQRVIQQTLQMQQQTPGLGRIYMPPQLLSNLRGAYGPYIDAAGFIQVRGGEGYVVRLTSRSADGARIFGQDALFSVPMGGMAMNAMGHRVQLKALIPRDPQALYQGFWIEAEAARLRGERPGAAPQIASFVLNYRAQI